MQISRPDPSDVNESIRIVQRNIQQEAMGDSLNDLRAASAARTSTSVPDVVPDSAADRVRLIIEWS